MDLSTLQLSDALTAAGAVGVAALIAGVIALAKNLRGIGPWLDAGNEPTVVFVLAALIVIAAVASAGTTVTLPVIFGGFVAWYGIAEVAMAVHDRSNTIAPLVLTQQPPAS
jgi:uncharacterized membrane protein HdeD (DUF308 family)